MLDGRLLWQIERDVIEAAISRFAGSIPKAADALGISPSTIYRKRENWAAMPA
jgi:two-component system repressor protein LuxO